MISIINIHAILYVHNFLIARAINSSLATMIELTTTPMTTSSTMVSEPVIVMREPTSHRNKTRDFSYVGHQLIRPRYSTQKTTKFTTSSPPPKNGEKALYTNQTLQSPPFGTGRLHIQKVTNRIQSRD